MPTLMLDAFRERLNELIAQEREQWESVGFATPDGRVLPFGTDTKVISTVFEAFAAPYIFKIAKEYGYSVEGSAQTIYPDFTLVPNDKENEYIAVDIKTTYRKGGSNSIVFTLGSYTSFLRDASGTKNIHYPYHKYSEHWVLCFVYDRLDDVDAKNYEREIEAGKLLCPYKNVEFCVQHKHLVAGKRPGSGNTANIGSKPVRSLSQLVDGSPEFTTKVDFEKYWRSYKK